MNIVITVVVLYLPAPEPRMHISSTLGKAPLGSR